MPLKTASETGLIGFFGHTYGEEGGGWRVIKRQFRISRRLNENAYVVQWFSFLDGEPTSLGVLHEADLLDPEKTKLYATRKEWLTAYEKMYAYRGSRHPLAEPAK